MLFQYVHTVNTIQILESIFRPSIIQIGLLHLLFSPRFTLSLLPAPQASLAGISNSHVAF